MTLVSAGLSKVLAMCWWGVDRVLSVIHITESKGNQCWSTCWLYITDASIIRTLSSVLGLNICRKEHIRLGSYCNLGNHPYSL